MRKNISLILTLFLVLVTAVFSLANRQAVPVNYLFGEFRLPLVLIILGSFLIGFLLQYILGISKSLSHKHDIKELKKELKAKQEELDKAYAKESKVLPEEEVNKEK